MGSGGAGAACAGLALTGLLRVLCGPKNSIGYEHDHEAVLRRLGNRLLYHGPTNPLFRAAMGDYHYVIRTPDLAEMVELATYIQKRLTPVAMQITHHVWERPDLVRPIRLKPVWHPRPAPLSLSSSGKETTEIGKTLACWR